MAGDAEPVIAALGLSLSSTAIAATLDERNLKGTPTGEAPFAILLFPLVDAVREAFPELTTRTGPIPGMSMYRLAQRPCCCTIKASTSDGERPCLKNVCTSVSS